MNRLEIRDAIGQELSKNTSSMDTLTTARLLGYVNRRHRAILSMPGLQHLRQGVILLTSEANRFFYGIPNVAQVQRIWDTTNDRTLSGLSLAQYRQFDPLVTQASQTGTPEFWVLAGLSATARQLTPGSGVSSLEVDSTAAGDTGTAFVGYRLTDGSVREVSVTMTGTTEAAFTLGGTAAEIIKFYLSVNAVGSVTLQSPGAGGPTIYATIGIGTKQTRHYALYLWPTPSAAIAYHMDVLREIPDLAQDTDEPWLPLDFHDLLVLGAACDEYRHLDDSRAEFIERQYHKRLGQLQYWIADTATGQGDVYTDNLGTSRLGPWFPKGS